MKKKNCSQQKYEPRNTFSSTRTYDANESKKEQLRTFDISRTFDI